MEYDLFKPTVWAHNTQSFGFSLFREATSLIIGRVHSLETKGLVDGPRIRTVVFFQGCRLRC